MVLKGEEDEDEFIPSRTRVFRENSTQARLGEAMVRQRTEREDTLLNIIAV